jgi:hypothetical protein
MVFSSPSFAWPFGLGMDSTIAAPTLDITPGTIEKKVSVGRDVYIRDWTGYRGVTS